MPAWIRKLTTRMDRLRVEQGTRLKQIVLEYADSLPDQMPDRPVGKIIAEIDRQTASTSKWNFVMVGPTQNKAVVSWLITNSTRATTAVRLWAELFDNLRTDTGEILLTREELADRIGCTPDNISEIMGELESIGAISRWREKVAGMRGPGMVRYRMNEYIATHLTGQARDKAQASAPPLLTVMEGGKPS